MKHLFLILAIVLFSVPASAQESAPVADAVSVRPKQLELAREMHDIWPIRTRIEGAIQTISESFPEDKQAEVKAAVRKAIQFDQVEEASIQAMAEVFTEEELKAMIAFYGSDVGRSVSAKTGDYENALRPVMSQMLDKAMLDLRTGQAQ